MKSNNKKSNIVLMPLFAIFVIILSVTVLAGLAKINSNQNEITNYRDEISLMNQIKLEQDSFLNTEAKTKANYAIKDTYFNLDTNKEQTVSLSNDKTGIYLIDSKQEIDSAFDEERLKEVFYYYLNEKVQDKNEIDDEQLVLRNLDSTWFFSLTDNQYLIGKPIDNIYFISNDVALYSMYLIPQNYNPKFLGIKVFDAVKWLSVTPFGIATFGLPYLVGEIGEGITELDLKSNAIKSITNNFELSYDAPLPEEETSEDLSYIQATFEENTYSTASDDIYSVWATYFNAYISQDKEISIENKLIEKSIAIFLGNLRAKGIELDESEEKEIIQKINEETKDNPYLIFTSLKNVCNDLSSQDESSLNVFQQATRALKFSAKEDVTHKNCFESLVAVQEEFDKQVEENKLDETFDYFKNVYSYRPTISVELDNKFNEIFNLELLKTISKELQESEVTEDKIKGILKDNIGNEDYKLYFKYLMDDKSNEFGYNTFRKYTTQGIEELSQDPIQWKSQYCGELKKENMDPEYLYVCVVNNQKESYATRFALKLGEYKLGTITDFTAENAPSTQNTAKLSFNVEEGSIDGIYVKYWEEGTGIEPITESEMKGGTKIENIKPIDYTFGTPEYEKTSDMEKIGTITYTEFPTEQTFEYNIIYKTKTGYVLFFNNENLETNTDYNFAIMPFIIKDSEQITTREEATEPQVVKSKFPMLIQDTIPPTLIEHETLIKKDDTTKQISVEFCKPEQTNMDGITKADDIASYHMVYGFYDQDEDCKIAEFLSNEPQVATITNPFTLSFTTEEDYEDAITKKLCYLIYAKDEIRNYVIAYDNNQFKSDTTNFIFEYDLTSSSTSWGTINCN